MTRLITRIPILAVIAALAGLTTTAGAQQNIVYVDDDGLLSGDGTSWGMAFRFLQDALDEWNGAFQTVEIRVAQGTYRPDERIATPVGSLDRNETFMLSNDLSIVGGFRGLLVQPGQSPGDRDVAKFQTVLSGDLFLNDDPPFSLTDNSIHVITGSFTNSTAVLDGITITAGFSELNGGCLINDLGSPTLIDCTFTQCVAGDSGGAIANQTGSNPIIDGCTFLANSATGGPVGSFGGAIANLSGSAPNLNDCIFEDNLADTFGGAVYNGVSVDVTINDCSITNNTAGLEGGGIYSTTIATLGVGGSTLCGNQPDNVIGPMTDNGGNTICGGPCPQDLNGNGDVDFADIFEIISNWGPCGGCPQDINDNGEVDFADIFEVIGNWGPCP